MLSDVRINGVFIFDLAASVSEWLPGPLALARSHWIFILGRTRATMPLLRRSVRSSENRLNSVNPKEQHSPSARHPTQQT